MVYPAAVCLAKMVLRRRRRRTAVPNAAAVAASAEPTPAENMSAEDVEAAATAGGSSDPGAVDEHGIPVNRVGACLPPPSCTFPDRCEGSNSE